MAHPGSFLPSKPPSEPDLLPFRSMSYTLSWRVKNSILRLKLPETTLSRPQTKGPMSQPPSLPLTEAPPPIDTISDTPVVVAATSIVDPPPTLLAAMEHLAVATTASVVVALNTEADGFSITIPLLDVRFVDVAITMPQNAGSVWTSTTRAHFPNHLLKLLLPPNLIHLKINGIWTPELRATSLPISQTSRYTLLTMAPIESPLAMVNHCPSITPAQDKTTMKTLIQGRSDRGLYLFPPSSPSAFLSATQSSPLWHNRLGHPSSQILSVLASSTLYLFHFSIMYVSTVTLARVINVPFLVPLLLLLPRWSLSMLMYSVQHLFPRFEDINIM